MTTLAPTRNPEPDVLLLPPQSKVRISATPLAISRLLGSIASALAPVRAASALTHDLSCRSRGRKRGLRRRRGSWRGALAWESMVAARRQPFAVCPAAVT